jgi:hypothetical protein
MASFPYSVSFEVYNCNQLFWFRSTRVFLSRLLSSFCHRVSIGDFDFAHRLCFFLSQRLRFINPLSAVVSFKLAGFNQNSCFILTNWLHSYCLCFLFILDGYTHTTCFSLFRWLRTANLFQSLLVASLWLLVSISLCSFVPVTCFNLSLWLRSIYLFLSMSTISILLFISFNDHSFAQIACFFLSR